MGYNSARFSFAQLPVSKKECVAPGYDKSDQNSPFLLESILGSELAWLSLQKYGKVLKRTYLLIKKQNNWR